jgi:hypothetical protein
VVIRFKFHDGGFVGFDVFQAVVLRVKRNPAPIALHHFLFLNPCFCRQDTIQHLLGFFEDFLLVLDVDGFHFSEILKDGSLRMADNS